MKRFTKASLILKLFMTILFFPACSHAPEEKAEALREPLHAVAVTGDWWRSAECMVQTLDAASVRRWPHGTVQGVWPEKQAQRATIPVRRTSDMATLYTITVHGGKAVLDSVPHAHDIYMETLEREMKGAMDSCAQTP